MQPFGLLKRLKRGNKTVFSVGSQDLTLNELHAILLGVVMGIQVGWTFSWGMERVAMGEMAILVSYAVFGGVPLHSVPDDEIEETVALRTICYEPWWFLTPFVVLAGVIALA